MAGKNQGQDQAYVEYIALDELIKFPRNPKDHDIGAIHSSISRFGYIQPILIDETSGKIVGGHGRLDTLQQMKAAGQPPPHRISQKDGDWTVPVIRGIAFESEEEAEAYLLADNRLTILGGWNDSTLSLVLKDLATRDALLGTGFDAEDLDALIRKLDITVPDPGEPPDPVAKSEVLIEIRCARGDLEQFSFMLDEWSQREGVTVDIS